MRERLDDDSVDCVITDPPYGIDYEPLRANAGEVDNYGAGGIEGDELEDTVALWHDFLSEIQRVCKPGGHIYAFGSMLHRHIFQPVFEQHTDLQNIIVWVKNNHSMGPDFSENYGMAYEDIFYGHLSDTPRKLDEFSTNVLEFDKEDTGEYGHPTQKPVPLLSYLVKQSTKEGDTILDPFMGSGTTAVAAIQNDREYVGFEVDADNYRDVIERRISEAKRQVEANVD
jgi:site-specific DNA-methyltransferase (adenine-specific)